jgi:entericidin B
MSARSFHCFRAEEAAMRARLIAVLPLLALLLLAACHTVEGAGEDLSAAGHAITNSAEKMTQ